MFYNKVVMNKLKKLSFILIHLGTVCLVLSYIYGLFVSFKYSGEIKLEYPFILFSYFVIGIGLLIRTMLIGLMADESIEEKTESAPLVIKIILIILIINASAAALLIVKKFIQLGYVPFASFGGTFLFIICFLSCILVYILQTDKDKLFALFSIILIFVLDVAAFIFAEPAKKLPEVFNTYWFYIHVTSSMVAYSFLAASFLASLVYLINKTKLKQYKLIYGLGIFFYFVLIVSGSIWAQNAWGAYWSWDPKETAALITFLIYYYALHVKGKKHYYFNILGFFSLIFCYVGITFLMKGLHSYK